MSRFRAGGKTSTRKHSGNCDGGSGVAGGVNGVGVGGSGGGCNGSTSGNSGSGGGGSSGDGGGGCGVLKHAAAGKDKGGSMSESLQNQILLLQMVLKVRRPG